jgi:hypothetical protein
MRELEMRDVMVYKREGDWLASNCKRVNELDVWLLLGGCGTLLLSIGLRVRFRKREFNFGQLAFSVERLDVWRITVF